MEIFKKEINGKLHIRIEYTEAEKAEMEAKRQEILEKRNTKA